MDTSSNQLVKVDPTIVFEINERLAKAQVRELLKAPRRVIGGLLGKELSGLELRLSAAFDFEYTLNPATSQIASLNISTAQDIFSNILYDKVNMGGRQWNHFIDYKFLCWFSAHNGAGPLEGDLQHHQELKAAFHVNQLYYLVLDISKLNGSQELPLKLYIDKGNTFVPYTYLEDPERGVVTIIEEGMRKDAKSDGSVVSKALESTKSALNTLDGQIEYLLNALDDPAIKDNKELIRLINQISLNYPQSNYIGNNEKLVQEFSNAQIISLLSGISVTNRKVGVVYEKNRSDFEKIHRSLGLGHGHF